MTLTYYIVWCLRRILGFKWSDFVRNEDVRHATQQPPLSSIVKTRRLSLFGHIAGMNESTDASRILFEPPSSLDETSGTATQFLGPDCY